MINPYESPAECNDEAKCLFACSWPAVISATWLAMTFWMVVAVASLHLMQATCEGPEDERLIKCVEWTVVTVFPMWFLITCYELGRKK